MNLLVKIIISIAFTFASTIITPKSKTNKISGSVALKETILTKNDTLTSCEENCKISSIETLID